MRHGDAVRPRSTSPSNNRGVRRFLARHENFRASESDFPGERGFWHCTVTFGARIAATSLKKDETADRREPFSDGWLDQIGLHPGRSVDVAMLPGGSLRNPERWRRGALS